MAAPDTNDDAPRALEVLTTTTRRDDHGLVDLVEVTLRVPRDLVYFSGHFPNDPVLPGVVQLNDAALAQVERAWPELGRLRGIRRLKFIHTLKPGDTILLRLERRAKPGQIAFTIHKDDDVLCTSAVLLFAMEGES